MTHPKRFVENDPILRHVRDLCLAFPGAAEKVSHGRPNFFTKKVFAIYGASAKGDHASDRHATSLVFQPDPDERPGLLADERFFVPAYYGPSGWIGLELDGHSDWTEVAELVEESFRNTAPKRLIADLDRSKSA